LFRHESTLPHIGESPVFGFGGAALPPAAIDVGPAGRFGVAPSQDLSWRKAYPGGVTANSKAAGAALYDHADFFSLTVH
jgi:hypothetical protein